MAAVFPLDTSQPWIFNGVTYEYDAEEDRWFVVSTVASDQVVENLQQLEASLLLTNETIEQEIENRTELINAAAGINNQQNAAIDELDGRLDAISENIGILEFKGEYTYVLEKTQAACDAAYIACLAEAGLDEPSRAACNRLHGECSAAVGTPLESGTFTSVGTIDQNAVEELIIHNSDKNGLTFDWENLLEVGDYIELVEKTQLDTVLYEVISDPVRSDDQETIRVKFIKETGDGDGSFNLQETSGIRIFKKDLGLDLNDADDRYVLKPYTVIFADVAPSTGGAPSGTLKNGEMWYDTSNLELFVWNNNAWVSCSKPATQDIVFASVQQQVSALEARPKIISSNEAPEDPNEGDLWFNTTTLNFAFYASGGWVNPDRS